MSRPQSYRLVVASATLTLALGSATTSSATGTDASGGLLGQAAIPVQQVLDPVAFALCTAEGQAAVQKCEAVGSPPTYQVPPGRRLIVEQVSGLPFRVQIVAHTQGIALQHFIIGVTRADAPGGQVPLTLTRIYGDPNSQVTIGLTEVPANAGRFCHLTFSGQLVKR